MAARTLFSANADAKASPAKPLFDGMSYGSSGSMGTAHGGVYAVAQDADLTDGMTFMAGTSIGALVALAAALNLPATFLPTALFLDLIKLSKFGDTYVPSYSSF